MTFVDHYAVLGVTATADWASIRAAHRARARRYHPDLGGDEGEMIRINEAWRVLRDPGLRARYDADRVGRVRTRPGATADLVLDFGRYEGRRLLDVARTDPDYLEWLMRTPAGRHLRQSIEMALAASHGPGNRASFATTGG